MKMTPEQQAAITEKVAEIIKQQMEDKMAENQ